MIKKKLNIDDENNYLNEYLTLKKTKFESSEEFIRFFRKI